MRMGGVCNDKRGTSKHVALIGGVCVCGVGNRQGKRNRKRSVVCRMCVQ
jgi:hypothetical protein